MFVTYVCVCVLMCGSFQVSTQIKTVIDSELCGDAMQLRVWESHQGELQTRAASFCQALFLHVSF